MSVLRSLCGSHPTPTHPRRRGATTSSLLLLQLLLVTVLGVTSLVVHAAYDVDLFDYDDTLFHQNEPRPSTVNVAHHHGAPEVFFSAPSSHRHHPRNFAAQAICPDCGDHGRCIQETGTCRCDGEEQNDPKGWGSWTGIHCDKCKFGFALSGCNKECNGGSCNVCNSHGTCNMGTGGDGTCDCWDQFDGVDCNECTPIFYGADCSSSCPGIEQHAAACFGRGKCHSGVAGTGKCTCDIGFGGDCLECDAAHFGSNCQYKCQGYTVTTVDTVDIPTPCSGHGRCRNGTSPTADGSCVCDTYFGTADCSKECPNQCGGHGVCNDGVENDATCKCVVAPNSASSWWALPDCTKCIAKRTGPDCGKECPINTFTSMICSGQGNCTYDSLGAPICICAPGYTGDKCDIVCPGSPPCSGHGTCAANPQNPSSDFWCVCYQDTTNGYWTGPTCDRCSLSHNQSETSSCTKSCPLSTGANPGVVCNGHGACMDGRCYCDVIGNVIWCNTPADALTGACEVTSFSVDSKLCGLVICPQEWYKYGQACTGTCDGYSAFTGQVCSGHGFCNNGFYGDGTCACQKGYGGTDCEIYCPVNATSGLMCSGPGHGSCVTTRNENNHMVATCACYEEFRGTACELECPMRNGYVCAGHGSCSHNTAQNTVACDCTSDFTGIACDVPCSCNAAHGKCNLTMCAHMRSDEDCGTRPGECECQGNFTGQCDRCLSGTQGTDCSGECVHGATQGTLCLCTPQWNTASCSVPCPRGKEMGSTGPELVCSGHGECKGGNLHDGSCTCYGTNGGIPEDGVPAYFGAACSVFCTVAKCSTRAVNPLFNPECRLDGPDDTEPCKCRNDDTGHWDGLNASCSVCAKGYWGPTCTEACECNGHGACDMNTNECQCDTSVKLGFWAGSRCESCLEGYIGQNCERRNVAITRLQRNITVTESAKLRAPMAVFVNDPEAPPMPQLLNVDPDRRRLYAGSTPAFKLDVQGSNMVQMEESMDPKLLDKLSNVGGIAIYKNGVMCDPGEVVYAAIRETMVFLLLQSSPKCDTPIRLITIARDPAADDIDNEGTFGLNNKTFRPTLLPLPIALLNSTLRVIAASDEESVVNVASRREFFAFVVSQPRSGAGGPGHFFGSARLFRVRLDKLALLSPPQNAVETVPLPASFIPYDVTIASAPGTQSQIAIGGSTNGEWDVIEFDAGLDSVSLRDTSKGGVRCWPTLSDKTPIDPGQCTGCEVVEKIRFVPQFLPVPGKKPQQANNQKPISSARSLLLSIRKADQSILVWLQDVTATKAGQTVVAETSQGDCLRGQIIPSILPSGNPTAPKITSPNFHSGVQLQEVSWYALVAASNVEKSSASAIAVDEKSWIAYVSYNLTAQSQPSMLNKYSLEVETFGVYGQQQLRFATRSATQTVPEVISRLVIDSNARVMYGIVEGIPSLRIASFLLYEMHTLTPDLADQRGGTVVTVDGSGFQRIVNDSTVNPPTYFPIMCRFGKVDEDPKYVQADLRPSTDPLSYTKVECNASAVDNETVAGAVGSCAGQTVEISFYGSRVDWYTENRMTIKRVQAARIEEAPVPDRGPMSGDTAVTLTGQSFVLSEHSKCKFYSTNTEVENPPPLYSYGSGVKWVSPNQVICIQPVAQAASLFKSWVDFANDGQLYSEKDPGPQEYQIVGGASNISAVLLADVPSNKRHVVATNESYFNVTVSVVDSENHRLGVLDTVLQPVHVRRNITLISTCDLKDFLWRTEFDPYPWPPCRDLVLNNSRPIELSPKWPMVPVDTEWALNTQHGTIDFNDIFFYEPRTATLVLDFVSTEAGRPVDWSTKVTVQIMEGSPYALAIANRNELVGEKHYFAGTQPLVSIEIIVIDRMGNIVQNPGSVEITARTFYIPNVVGGVQVTTATTPKTHRVDGGNKIRFSELNPEFRHDVSHYIEFTAKPVLEPTITPMLETAICDNPEASYKVSNTDACLACPPVGAVCNGTEIINVLPGYWRAASTKVDIYECEEPLSCLGGASPHTPCREGHTGPLCSLCNASWGKAGKSCTRCPPLTEAWLTVAGGGIAFIIILLVWTVFTLRKDEVTDLSVILRTVVNHMQATGKLGEFSVRWGTTLKSLFSFQAAGSDVSVSGLASVECLLKEYNRDYTVVFAGYMCLPILSLLMAFLVYVTVRALKMKPVITAKLRDEIMEDIKNMGNRAKTRRLLELYPFYFVLVTTFCVHMFAMYQTFITQSTSVLKCKDIVIGREVNPAGGESDVVVSKKFLVVDMNIECSDEGNHHLRTPALICAIGYGFGVPIVFIFGYKFMNGRIAKPELTKLMFMFLIGGYKEKYWFWQAIIMIRKLVLVLVIVFVEENKQLQSYCGMWAMSLALIIQIWFQPNTVREHNLVEALSLAIITITLNLGLLYFWPGIEGGPGEFILTMTLIVITLGAIIIFIYFMWKPLKDTIRQGIEAGADTLKSIVDPAAKKKAEEEEAAAEEAAVADGKKKKKKVVKKLQISQLDFGGDDDGGAEELDDLDEWTSSGNRSGKPIFKPHHSTAGGGGGGGGVGRRSLYDEDTRFETVELEEADPDSVEFPNQRPANQLYGLARYGSKTSAPPLPRKDGAIRTEQCTSFGEDL